MLGVVAIEVDALAGETRHRLCPIPHVIEVDTLDVIEHGVIVGKRGGTHLLIGRTGIFRVTVAAIVLAGRESHQEYKR